MTRIRTTHLNTVPHNRRYLFGFVLLCGCGQYVRTVDYILRRVWCIACDTSRYCFMFPGEYPLAPGEVVGWYD